MSLLTSALAKKALRYAEVFAVAFVTFLLAHVSSLAGTHGLSGWKSAVLALVLAAATAGWDAVKTQTVKATKKP